MRCLRLLDNGEYLVAERIDGAALIGRQRARQDELDDKPRGEGDDRDEYRERNEDDEPEEPPATKAKHEQ